MELETRKSEFEVYESVWLPTREAVGGGKIVHEQRDQTTV